MTEGPFLVQCFLPYFSGFPGDGVSNNFHFLYDGVGYPDSTAFTAVANVVSNFFETIYATNSKMAAYARPANFNQKIYDLNDATPRTPRFMRTDPLSVVQDTAPVVPTEVALVCSFRHNPSSGTNPARYRGRIYLGALGDNGGGVGGASAYPRPNTNLINNIKTAGHDLIASVASTSFRWVVYSPTRVAGGASKIQASETVQNGWVDDTYDTQRRRGVPAINRNTWS